MVIHARVRVEPKQKNCWHRKVFHVDNITDMVTSNFQNHPSRQYLLSLPGRYYDAMEDRAKNKPERSHMEKKNRHNLDMIQDLLDNGMWDVGWEDKGCTNWFFFSG